MKRKEVLGMEQKLITSQRKIRLTVTQFVQSMQNTEEYVVSRPDFLEISVIQETSRGSLLSPVLQEQPLLSLLF